MARKPTLKSSPAQESALGRKLKYDHVQEIAMLLSMGPHLVKEDDFRRVFLVLSKRYRGADRDFFDDLAKLCSLEVRSDYDEAKEAVENAIFRVEMICRHEEFGPTSMVQRIREWHPGVIERFEQICNPDQKLQPAETMERAVSRMIQAARKKVGQILQE